MLEFNIYQKLRKLKLELLRSNHIDYFFKFNNLYLTVDFKMKKYYHYTRGCDKMFEKLRNTLIATSVFYLIVGIFMLLFPATVSDIICYLVAFMFLFFGISGVVMYTKTEIKTPYTSSTLILAIILGAFGIYIFLNPKAFASFIPLVIGIFLIADSISKLSAAFDLKKYDYINWWHMLIISFIILVFGLILVFNPFEVITVSIMVIGAILIVDAISNMFTIYSYSKIDKK